MQKALVLPHQSKYMLAPYLYPELRYFFLVCGYGSGKTRANAIALAYAIKILQNKKDRAGDYARLIVAGYTLSHLNKTILPYLRQYLAQSRTPYTENKKDNYFDIGTVRVLVIPIENPENIFGYDAWACVGANTKVLCRSEGRIQRKRIKDMSTDDHVFTRNGWRRVVRVIPKGVKTVMRVNNLICTPDHAVWSDGWSNAETVRKDNFILGLTAWRIRVWEDVSTRLGKVRASVSCLTELLTTGILTETTKAGRSISSALRNLVRVFISMLLFGRAFTALSPRDVWYIIKTVIRSIIELTILRLCLPAYTPCFTTGSVCSTLWNGKNSGDVCGRRSRRGVGWFLHGIVLCAARSLTQGPEPRNTAQKCVRNGIIENKTLKRRQPLCAGGAGRNLRQASLNGLCSVVSDAMTRINTIVEELPPSVIVKRERVRYAGNTSLLRAALKRLPVPLTAKMLNGDRRCEVYDLTVDGNDSHEFFANGILVHNCFVEELDELTEDKALEAVRALSERCRQQIIGFREPFLCFGSTSQGQKGLYRIYNHFKKTGVGFLLIRGRTQDNPFLPKSQIEFMLKSYTPEEKCIAASEKILVRHNSRIFRCRAKNISVGWEVFTRIGWQRIRQVRVSGMKPVGRLLGLRLTGDHRVETGFGWKRADSVKTAQIYDEKEIIVWTRLQELKIAVKEARRKLFDMMENSGTGIQSRQDRVAKTIGAVVQNAIRDVKAICCMSIYGNSGTVRCLKVLWYITWTTIRIIMLLRILSRFRCRNIVCCISMIPVCGKKAFPLFGRCTRIARVIQRFANCAGKRFLRNTGVRGFAGRTKTLSDEETLNVVRKKERGMRCGSLSVSIAEKLFTGIRRTLISVLLRAGKRMPLLERFLPCVPVVVKCSWRKVKKHAFVPVNAEQDTSICEVIDIEVEKPHEFVAKGLLVHNCVFMDGEFLAIAKGRVLGDFSWERNYLDYDLDTALLPGETVYVGMDFNTSYNRASAYVVRDGVIYCIKYYDFPDPQDAPSVFRHDFPAQRILWIPDVTIKDSFPQFARELRKYGLQIIYRKKNPLVEDTVFLVNKLFYTGRLMVCKIAKDLAEACALAMRDKDNKIPKGVGPSSAIHSVDGLRYVTSFVCMRDKAFHDIRKLIIDKRASFRSDSDKPIQDLGGGYMQIDPSALYHGKKL